MNFVMSIKYVDRDGKIFEGDYDLMIARHTTSHVMAQAVKRLYPSAKLAIGPAIENGFYYDFDFSFPFTEPIALKT